jgi:hypothetical protein
MAKEKEQRRQAELARQRQEQREREREQQRQAELARQQREKEKDQQRQAELARQRQEQREREREQQRQAELARQQREREEKRRRKAELARQQQQKEEQERHKVELQRLQQQRQEPRAPLREVGNEVAGGAAALAELDANGKGTKATGSPPAGDLTAAAQLQVPEGGAADPAFSDFVLDLMGCLGYSDDDADAAEAKLMAVAEQAVVGNAPAGAASAGAGDSVTGGAGSSEMTAPAGAQAVAAHRWLHQFNSGLVRRHARLVEAVVGRGGGGVEAVGAGLRAWIDSNLMGAGQMGM